MNWCQSSSFAGQSPQGAQHKSSPEMAHHPRAVPSALRLRVTLPTPVTPKDWTGQGGEGQSCWGRCGMGWRLGGSTNRHKKVWLRVPCHLYSNSTETRILSLPEHNQATAYVLSCGPQRRKHSESLNSDTVGGGKRDGVLPKHRQGISLVVQWLRIHLVMQRTWVWSLVWEDPTCCRSTKPTSCQLLSLSTATRVLCAAMKPTCWS